MLSVTHWPFYLVNTSPLILTQSPECWQCTFLQNMDMLKLYFSLCSVCNFMLWQHGTNSLVRFWLVLEKHHVLAGFVAMNTTANCPEISLNIPDFQLNISRHLVRNIRFCCHKHVWKFKWPWKLVSRMKRTNSKCFAENILFWWLD